MTLRCPVNEGACTPRRPASLPIFSIGILDPAPGRKLSSDPTPPRKPRRVYPTPARKTSNTFKENPRPHADRRASTETKYYFPKKALVSESYKTKERSRCKAIKPNTWIYSLNGTSWEIESYVHSPPAEFDFGRSPRTPPGRGCAGGSNPRVHLYSRNCRLPHPPLRRRLRLSVL